MFKIETSVPIPEKSHGPRGKYPFKDMKVGESFWVDGKDAKPASFKSQVSNAGKRFGLKFTCRNEGDGVRVWRLE